MAFVILVCFIPFNGCHCNPAFQICPLLQHCSHPRSAWTLPPLTDPSWWESRPYEERPRDRSRSPRKGPTNSAWPASSHSSNRDFATRRHKGADDTARAARTGAVHTRKPVSHGSGFGKECGHKK